MSSFAPPPPPAGYPSRMRERESSAELPSMPSMNPLDSDESSGDLSGSSSLQSSSTRNQRQPFASSSSEQHTLGNPNFLSAVSPFQLPPNSVPPTPFPATPASSQGLPPTPMTSTPLPHANFERSSSASSKGRFASSGPWAQETPGPNGMNDTFELSAIEQRELDVEEEGEEDGREGMSFGEEEAAREPSYREERSVREDDQRSNGSFGSISGAGDQEEEQEVDGEEPFVSRREEGQSFRDEEEEDDGQDYVDAGSFDIVDTSQHQQSGDFSLQEEGEQQEGLAAESMQERSDRLTRSRLPSAELSLVLEAPEEEEEQDQDSIDSRRSEEPASRSAFIQLGRRRSQADRRRTIMPAPALSPASVSASSSSNASTPNGASQTSGHRSLVRSSTSYDQEQEEFDDNDGPSPDQEHFSLTSPVKEYSFSIGGLDTPLAQRNSSVAQIQSTPLPTRPTEFFIPLQDVSPNSQSGNDHHPASYATPKQVPPFRSTSERQRDLVLSTLSSTGRPRIRGTPHTRRSIGGAGGGPSQTSIRQSSASPYGGGTTSFHSIHHPDDQLFQGDQSSVSIASSEDLTNVNRANTSLPVISDTPRNNGIKLQRHLHSLNTQQHLLIQTLQDENEALRYAVGDELPEGVGKSMPTRFDREGSVATSSGGVGEEDLALLGRMADQVARLEEALAEKNEELERVKSVPSSSSSKRGASLEPVVEDLSPQLQLVQSELTSTRSELSTHKDLLSQRSDELSALRTKLVETEASKSRQAADHALKFEKLEADITTILTEKEAELAVACQERDSLNEALKMKEGGRESVAEERVARLSAEVDSLKEELGNGREKIESLSVEARAAQETIQIQQEDLELAKVAVGMAQDERTSLLEKLGAADSSTPETNVVDLLEKVLSSSDNQLADLQEKLQGLEDEAALRTVELERVEGLLRSTTEDFADSTKEVASLKEKLSETEQILEEQHAKLGDEQDQLDAQDDKIAQLEDQNQACEEEIETLAAKVLDVERQLSEANILLESHAATIVQLEEAHSNAVASLQASYEDQITVLERALQEAEVRSSEDRDAISKLTVLVQELETTQEVLQSKVAEATRSPSPRLQSTPISSSRQRRSPTPTNVTLSTEEAETPLVVSLKGQLQTANFEIGRLQKELASSPFKRTAIESRDLRIRALESANANGDLRKNILRGQSVEPSGANGSFNSTIVYGSIQSPQTPKSLGPLRQMSIFDETPVPTRIASTLAQIDQLKRERDERNESADENWEVQKNLLMGQLEEALEEVERLQRELDKEREERSRVEGEKTSSGTLISSQLSTLQRNLASAKDELASTVRSKNTDRASFERKEASLKTDITKLKDELERQRKAASETRTEQRSVRTELSRSQSKVSGLESDVASLQKKVASLTDDLARSGRDRASSEGETMALKEELESTLSHLQDARDKVDSLQDLVDSRSAALSELERRTKATSTQKDGKSRELEELVRNNAQLEAKLRSSNQRSLDMTRHSDTLTSQLTAERLTSHQLRALLSTKDDADRARCETENEVVRTVNAMRSDIRTIRSEGQNVGREVLDQRRDRELEELMVKLESDLARARQENSALKAEHRLHSKSFLLQIEYYKKKFTRENTFRNDLSMQKAYLLILIGKLSRHQTRVNSAIAQMGYPGPRPVGPPPRRSFKSVALAVLMIVRTRTYAKNWKETSKINTAFREAAIRATEGRNERPRSSNSASNRS